MGAAQFDDGGQRGDVFFTPIPLGRLLLLEEGIRGKGLELVAQQPATHTFFVYKIVSFFFLSISNDAFLDS